MNDLVVIEANEEVNQEISGVRLERNKAVEYIGQFKKHTEVFNIENQKKLNTVDVTIKSNVPSDFAIYKLRAVINHKD